jgi:superfamily II DNA/RNA helicase
VYCVFVCLCLFVCLFDFFLPRLGYDRCTKVQAATLAAVAQGKDVLAKALTGTGKTMAFLIPTIERLAQQNARGQGGNLPIRALILSPTRELAQQVCVDFFFFFFRI